MSSSPFKPTIIGAVRPKPIEPTRIGATPACKVPVSALPGVPKTPLEVTPDELRRRFPGESDETLTEVRAFLSAAVADPGDARSWLAYGEDIQREAAALVSRRLAANQQDVLRAAPRHLARLQELLQAQAESLSAVGLLRPANPLRTWETIRPEIEQLGKALDLGLPAITDIHADSAGQMAEARRLERQTRVEALAAEVLAQQLSGQSGDVLAGRQASLLASAALLDELLVQLELDELRLAALIEQIREGVLVRLPSLVNSLAGLPAKPNDTERFLLTEKLAELIRFFERKR